MDAETQKIYSEGETVSDYIKTKGWLLVKDKFTEKMMDLQSVMNIEHGSEKSMAIDIRARQLAASYLFEILKEVEGIAQQHEANKPLTQDSIQVI